MAKKIKVPHRIFSKVDNKPIEAKEYKHLLEDEDVINAGYEEGYFSENNSYDGFFYLHVDRMVLETDEEFEKRKEQSERNKEEIKKRRYERYVILKKEFEDEK